MKKNSHKDLQIKKFLLTFAPPSDFKGRLAPAGSERLPYKQRVGGSNPSAPTEAFHESERLFHFIPPRGTTPPLTTVLLRSV